MVDQGSRGKLAERDAARALRAQAWTVPDIAAELAAMDSLGVQKLGDLSEQAFLAAGGVRYAGEACT